MNSLHHPSRNLAVSLATALVCMLLPGMRSVALATEPGIDFARDVQPILRRHCDRCHGTKNQEAGLQLNRRVSALGNADSGEAAVIPGDAAASLLMQRLVDEDFGDLMPLDGEPLSRREIETLRKWIDQGASWPDEFAEADHWAYQPLQRPAIPIQTPGSDAGQPIDAFVVDQLRRQELTLQPQADSARLVRRVSLALTGIPPTVDAVQAFVADPTDQAYERIVDGLLQSQRFGERWAIPWLDLARYADSNGFQADQLRDNWAYRDWVIRALNRDLPFDQFVIEQLAGDLLPDATVEQRIATGFHRMTTCNVEAGVHPEANRVNQVVDRVNTTATVFMGTTLECAQCHDHKYDPFTQADYYRIFAYFNNTPLEVENTSGVTWDFAGPMMELPLDRSRQAEHERLTAQIRRLEQRREAAIDNSDAAFANWIADLSAAVDAGAGWRTIRPESFESTGGEEVRILDDGAVLLSGTLPKKVRHTFTFAPESGRVAAIRIDALTDDSIPGKGPGRGDATKTNVILNEVVAELVGAKDSTRLELTDAVADFSQTGWPVSGAIDGKPKTGWAFSPRFGEPHWARFAFANPVNLNSDADRLRVTLVQNFGSGRVYGKPRVALYVGDPILLGVDDEVVELARLEVLSAPERKRLREAFAKHNPIVKRIDRQLQRAHDQFDGLQPETTLVMVEMDESRDTFVMKRGDYESLGDQVEAGTPAIFPRDPATQDAGDRLAFARWLTSPANPLLARVTVNRWWAALFGTGIVSTPEDFGTQSDPPSHPELLDWLASELVSSDWSMKHVLKQIVMSDTFRQSSRATPELLELDPGNRSLARGPRFRLPAELVRDNALAVSGLLSTKMFGPPVMPYQPENFWRSIGRNQPKWETALDQDRFRRGLYVVFKRAAPYPSFTTFDSPDRGSCTVQRPRTNTPLQALTLLNDPAYAEMALALADRILVETPAADDSNRIQHAFELTVARLPVGSEIRAIEQLLRSERKLLAAQPELVEQRLGLSRSPLSLQSDSSERAVWFAIANVLLNLDETMSL